MPEPNSKLTTPSPSIWDRITSMFQSSPMTPEMQQGLDIAKKENPNLAPVSTYGPVSRALMGNGTEGYTSPAGTIYLNPATMQGHDPQQIADTIAHENMHAQQMQQRGGGAISEFLREAFKPQGAYSQRPDELEAYQTEKNRRAARGAMQEPIPSFTNPGSFYYPTDTNLPVDKLMDSPDYATRAKAMVTARDFLNKYPNAKGSK